jgi:hypothetical protein
MLLHRTIGMLGVTRDEKIGSDVLKVTRDLVLGKTTLCDDIWLYCTCELNALVTTAKIRQTKLGVQD